VSDVRLAVFGESVRVGVGAVECQLNDTPTLDGGHDARGISASCVRHFTLTTAASALPAQLVGCTVELRHR